MTIRNNVMTNIQDAKKNLDRAWGQYWVIQKLPNEILDYDKALRIYVTGNSAKLTIDFKFCCQGKEGQKRASELKEFLEQNYTCSFDSKLTYIYGDFRVNGVLQIGEEMIDIIIDGLQQPENCKLETIKEWREVETIVATCMEQEND